MANKRVTDEQFSTGTTIDGTRIERAYNDTYNRFDAVEKNDLKQIFIPRTIYSGWQSHYYSEELTEQADVSPMQFAFPIYNSFDRDVATGTATYGRTDVNNPWRWKGTAMNGFNNYPQPAGSMAANGYNYTDVVGRTWSYYFDKPAIITDITVIWERDVYTGLYKEEAEGSAANAIEKAVINQYWFGQLFMDSPFAPDDKRKGSVLWRRTQTMSYPTPVDDYPIAAMIPRTSDYADLLCERTNRIPENDFQPNDYQNIAVVNALSNHPNYRFWWDKNLSISIPEASRVHFGLGCAIGNYSGSSPRPAPTPFGDCRSPEKAMDGFRYNIAIGVLEILE